MMGSCAAGSGASVHGAWNGLRPIKLVVLTCKFAAWLRFGWSLRRFLVSGWILANALDGCVPLFAGCSFARGQFPRTPMTASIAQFWRRMLSMLQWQDTPQPWLARCPLSNKAQRWCVVLELRGLAHVLQRFVLLPVRAINAFPAKAVEIGDLDFTRPIAAHSPAVPCNAPRAVNR
eukprot:3537834-Amphidinium_carterae.1